MKKYSYSKKKRRQKGGSRVPLQNTQCAEAHENEAGRKGKILPHSMKA